MVFKLYNTLFIAFTYITHISIKINQLILLIIIEYVQLKTAAINNTIIIFISNTIYTCEMALITELISKLHHSVDFFIVGFHSRKECLVSFD